MNCFMIILTSTVYNQSVMNFTTPPRFRCSYCLALQPSISTAVILLFYYAFPFTVPFQHIGGCSDYMTW